MQYILESSKAVVPNLLWAMSRKLMFKDDSMHNWPPLSLLYQTICLLCPKCEHLHPRNSDL